MPTIRTAHPAATPAARALALLATYTPADADDAAALLAAIHDHGNDSVISGLLAALHHLRGNIGQVPGVEPDAAQAIADHLQAATELISGAAADWIDRATALLPESQGEDESTEGIPSWELNPAPTEDPHAAPAAGYTMLTVPAREVREGDLIPAVDGWARVAYVHHDREDDSASLTYRYPSGRMGTRECVGAAADAILRRASNGTLADTLKAIRSDAEAVRSGRALTRAVPAARIIGHVEQLLTALGEKNGADSWDEPPPADPQLLKFIDAAIIHALDLATGHVRGAIYATFAVIAFGTLLTVGIHENRAENRRHDEPRAYRHHDRNHDDAP